MPGFPETSPAPRRPTCCDSTRRSRRRGRRRTTSACSVATSPGFPNGRRPKDDVVTIELRAIAGATFPLVDPTFTPDAVGSASSPMGSPRRRQLAVPRPLPVPRPAVRRVQQPVLTEAPRGGRSAVDRPPPARLSPGGSHARPAHAGGVTDRVRRPRHRRATSARWCSTSPADRPAERSRSAGSDRPVRVPTPPSASAASTVERCTASCTPDSPPVSTRSGPTTPHPAARPP